jgi:DNA excision repair protein ERCC-2
MEELFGMVNSSISNKCAIFVETNPNLNEKTRMFLEIFERFVGKEFCKMIVVGTDVFTCKKIIRKIFKARPDVPAVFLSADLNERSVGVVISGVEKMRIQGKDQDGLGTVQDLGKEAQIIVCTQAFLFRKGKDLLQEDFLLILEDALQLDVRAIDHLSINIDLKLVSAAIRGIQEMSDLISTKRCESDASFTSYLHTLKTSALSSTLSPDTFPRGISTSNEILQKPVPGNLRRPEFFLKLLKTVCVFIRSSLRGLEPSINSCHYFHYNLFKTWLVPRESLSISSSIFCSLITFFSINILKSENFFALYTICEFLSLSALHPEIYSVIYEPHSEQASVRSPILQLSCQDPSVFLGSLLKSFNCKVLFTSSYSQVSASFVGIESKVFYFPEVPDICSLVLTRGSDQLFLSTKSDEKVDDGVIRNYGEVLLDLSEVVPDGLVAVFPDWKTLMSYVVKWNESGLILRLLENKLVFIENTENEQKLMKNFKKACECGRGAVFFTVAREKCLEMMNQYGKFVRCSLVFGVPQGGVLSRVLRARLVYLKKHLNVDEADYLNYDAMRDAVWAISQGVKCSDLQQAVVFVDRRFDSSQKRTRIPKWILSKIKAQNSVSKDSAKDICSKYFKLS